MTAADHVLHWKRRPSGDEWAAEWGGAALVVFPGAAQSGWHAAVDGQVLTGLRGRRRWSTRDAAADAAVEHAARRGA